jgi:HlyD family secretion protein
MVRLGAQTVQNVVTYTAVIGVKNEDQALLPGMTANLQIVTDEREDVLRVPNAALRFRPTGNMTPTPARTSEAPSPRRPTRKDAMALDQGTDGRVYSLGPDGNPLAVAVRLGATDGSYTEILGGKLQEGAAIIIGGNPRGAEEANRPGPRSRSPRLF